MSKGPATSSPFAVRRGSRIFPAEARTETTTIAPKSATSRMLEATMACANTYGGITGR